MKRIDLHCHVLAFPEYSPRRWGGNKYLSVEEQIEIHDKCGVTFGVLHPIVIPEAHWATMSNEETQYIVNRYPDRFTWFCNVDPRQGNYTSKSDLGYIISQYKELGAKGLGELGTPLYADDPDDEQSVSFLRGIEYAGIGPCRTADRRHLRNC